MTDWMFHCIKGLGDTPAPCHLAFHKMLLQKPGVCWVTNASQMLITPHLETLKQLSQPVVFPKSPQRLSSSVFMPDFPTANAQQLWRECDTEKGLLRDPRGWTDFKIPLECHLWVYSC